MGLIWLHCSVLKISDVTQSGDPTAHHPARQTISQRAQGGYPACHQFSKLTAISAKLTMSDSGNGDMVFPEMYGYTLDSGAFLTIDGSPFLNNRSRCANSHLKSRLVWRLNRQSLFLAANSQDGSRCSLFIYYPMRSDYVSLKYKCQAVAPHGAVVRCSSASTCFSKISVCSD